MSWTDKASIEHIKQIRDIFKTNIFVETGTFKGMNVLVHNDNFNTILSCEINKKYYNIARKKCDYRNICIYNVDSPKFLKGIKKTYKDYYIIFYLDAHFYDKKRKNKFVVLDELKALKDFDKAIIIIHDFDNNLGHITYDGISLDMMLLKKDLLKVNPKFKFYTNELSSCDIITEDDLRVDGEIILKTKNDKDRYENLKYAWSKPEKTYRGILYCVPKKIKVDGLREIK